MSCISNPANHNEKLHHNPGSQSLTGTSLMRRHAGLGLDSLICLTPCCLLRFAVESVAGYLLRPLAAAGPALGCYKPRLAEAGSQLRG